MDESTARGRLAVGVAAINRKRAAWTRRENYRTGKQDLPYAPIGVNREYEELRQQAIANVLGLAMAAPVQRLRAEGYRTGAGDEADLAMWRDVWLPNRMAERQRIVYMQMMTHGRGVMAVWPNDANKRHPIVRVESDKRVHIEPDPENPFDALYAVKTFTVNAPPPTGLVAVNGAPLGTSLSTNVAVVYDRDSWSRWEAPAGSANASAGVGGWSLKAQGSHELGAVPFVPFDNDPNGDGVPQAAIEPLMPQQDAVNTIRFNTLLAMQFSAFRQRVFTGYDPVMRDENNNVIYRRNPDGSLMLDANGQPQPAVSSPGRIGVDRALVFPGADTKVFDLPESNLSNYTEVLGDFLTFLFATGQIPPQYLLTKMANLSGDALAGAESTLASLVADMKMWAGGSLDRVMQLARRARGETQPVQLSEVVWAEAEARSFAQTVDAITKLITAGFPRKAAYEMLAGGNPPKANEWYEQFLQEQRDVDPRPRAGAPDTGDVDDDELPPV